MFSGRLKRNLKRCRTLSALRVESALSFRPNTSWKRVSAVSLAPTRKADTEREGVRVKEAGENEKLGYYVNKCWYHISLLLLAVGLILLCMVFDTERGAEVERELLSRKWQLSLCHITWWNLCTTKWLRGWPRMCLQRGKAQVVLIKTKPHPQNKIPEGPNRGIFHFAVTNLSCHVANSPFLWLDDCCFTGFGGEWWSEPMRRGPSSLRLWGWKLRPVGRFIYSRLREKDLLIDPPLEQSHYHVWDERVETQNLLRGLLAKERKTHEGDWMYSSVLFYG